MYYVQLFSQLEVNALCVFLNGRGCLEDSAATGLFWAAHPPAHGLHGAAGQMHGGEGRPHGQVSTKFKENVAFLLFYSKTVSIPLKYVGESNAWRE